jgi:hypothetical protein
VEFWTHASRRPELRRKVAEQHERLLDTVGALVEEFARRWDVEFTMPAREVVRGTYALSRGMGLEPLLSEEPGTTTQYEEMFLAYVMACSDHEPGRTGPRRGGTHDHDDLHRIDPDRPPAGAGRRAAGPGPVVARPAARLPGRAAAGADRPRRGGLALLPGPPRPRRRHRRGAARRAADAAQGDADGQLRPHRHRPPAAPGRAGGTPGRERRRPAVPRALPAVLHRRHHRAARPVRGRPRGVRGLARHLPARHGQLGAGAGDPAGRDRLPQPAAWACRTPASPPSTAAATTSSPCPGPAGGR